MLRRRTMSTGKRETVQVVEELKSSGKWTVPAGCKSVDVFIVGGGGSGASSGPERGGGGGGSGCTELYLGISVTPGESINYVIGNGGNSVRSTSSYNDAKDGLKGQNSWFRDSAIYYANGGNGGQYSGKGGDGGSGGGSGMSSRNTAGYIGGSDGSNGVGDMPGIGQGTTTRCPFNNKLYAGGGGGGGEYSSGSSQGGGGIGIGGGSLGNPTNGKPNTGSGGGSFYISGSNVSGGISSGSGGSGIIVLRYNKYK